MTKKTMPAKRWIQVITALTLTLSAGFMAQAQTVYRCDNSYSDKPCPDAKTVDVSDKRSASQKMDADKLTRHEQQAAQKLEKERLQAEAASQRNRTDAAPTPPAKPAPTESKKIHKIRSYKDQAPAQAAKKPADSKQQSGTDKGPAASPVK